MPKQHAEEELAEGGWVYIWSALAAIHVAAVAVEPSPVPAEQGGGGGTGNPVFDWIGPIAGTGLVGIFFLMIVLKIKIMPTYVHDDAKKAWDDERTRLTSENTELKDALKDANLVYTTQVIPTLTRVLDAERELVDLRRDEQAERRRRGASN